MKDISIVVKSILKSYLVYLCGEENVEEDVPLSTKTTFCIGGPAKFFVVVPSKEVLKRLVSALRFIEEKFYVLGLGANTLALDEGYDGVVVKLGFSEIVENATFVYADAGVILGDLVNFASERGMSGMEWATGIPATVGGAIFMNAGAHGYSMADICVCVDVLIDGEVVNMHTKQLKLGYRTSVFHKKREWIILGAYFSLSRGDRQEIESNCALFQNKRSGTPELGPSAGSVFKRPRQDFYVGKAVDELGFRGKCIGGACVSEKHAGIIVNKGGATSKDVLSLVKLIKKEVYKKHGIRLQMENEILK